MYDDDMRRPDRLTGHQSEEKLFNNQELLIQPYNDHCHSLSDAIRTPLATTTRHRREPGASCNIYGTAVDLSLHQEQADKTKRRRREGRVSA